MWKCNNCENIVFKPIERYKFCPICSKELEKVGTTVVEKLSDKEWFDNFENMLIYLSDEILYNQLEWCIDKEYLDDARIQAKHAEEMCENLLGLLKEKRR